LLHTDRERVEASTPPPRFVLTVFELYGSIRALAVLRIVLGIVTLLHLRLFLRDAVDGVYYDDHFWEPFVSWFPHVPGEVWHAVLWVGAIAAVMLTVGLCTRIASIAAFGAVAFNLLISTTHVRHNRVFLMILLGGIALLPTGRVLSLDAWLRRRRGRPFDELAPLWPLYMLRVQVSMVYLASGFSKLIDPDWFGGLVLWDRVVRYQHVLDPTPLPEWAIDVLTSRWLYYGVAPAAVFTELFVGIALWFPRTRLVAIWTAVFFHLMIELSASVEVFSFAAIAALAIWVTPATRDRVVEIPDTSSAPLIGAAIRTMDWFGRFRVERAAADAFAVVDRDGSVHHGGEGVLLLLTRIPVTFFFAAPVHAIIRHRSVRAIAT
jgi:hypothetical protein